MLLLLSLFKACLTLCDPIDGSPVGPPVPGILQARTLEWVAISLSNACMHAKSLQLCLTLCNPIDCSPPGSSVPGILQARTLEWVAISFSNACMHAKSLQSCLTLCDPMDSSPPGSPVPGILQARILEWAAISLSDLIAKSRLTLWIMALQASLSKGFSRQEYWSGLPFPSPGNLPNPGIQLGSPALQGDALTSEPPGKPPVL